MNDKSLGMILATAIAAPVVVVCCVGGQALLDSALAGITGLFSGMGGLLSVLLAIAAGGLLLAGPRLRNAEDGCERSKPVSEPRL